MSNISTNSDLHRLLSALADQLSVSGRRVKLVIIGGSGLLAIGQVERATRDVALVALGSPDGLINPNPLPAYLSEAISQVATDFGLPADWLNSGPSQLLEFGLPEGFEDRLIEEVINENLTVCFASRLDQIHFKLYAMVDQGPGKHEQDLRSMNPAEEELVAAAKWSMSHDPSEGHRTVLGQTLEAMGVPNGADRL